MSEVELLVVDAAHAERRLDVVLAGLLGVSRSAAAARIDAGEVSVDGVTARRSRIVLEGEVLTVAADAVLAAVEAPDAPPIRYRDEHLLVVAKPAGMVVHAGAGHRGDTMVDALSAAGVRLAAAADPDRPGVVHRLDRDTSGLLLVASTPAALEGLMGMLSRHEVVRRYLALLVGSPDEPRGVVDGPLARHPQRRTRFAVVDGGKAARTRYRVLATSGTAADGVDLPVPASSVVCGLETGRTHQIRVHMEAVGTPVLGDPVYGTERRLSSALGATRPALHAARLAFDHPVTGEHIDLVEPLPDDLAGLWTRAGLPLPEGREEP
jgi:23S rRNA pseudouridine1911/1915/1917 synthase